MTRKIKKTAETIVWKTRAYHCSMKKAFDARRMDVVVDRDKDGGSSFGVLDRMIEEINMRAIARIESIPFFFWNNLGRMNFEYEDLVEKIEPRDRNDYFEWAYEIVLMVGQRRVRMGQGLIGRWIMDMEREVLEDPRFRRLWCLQ